MIRHLPMGTVPFEDCGYARSPYRPTIGEPIALDCECDAGTPTLELDGAPLCAPEAESLGGNRYRFALKPFARCATLRYRFAAAGERTPWFETEILRKVSVTAADTRSEPGAVSLRLADGLWLRAEACDAGFVTRLTREAGEGARAPATLVNGDFRLIAGEGLWTITRGGERVAVCERVELWQNATGAVRNVVTAVRGQHRHVWGTGERFDAVDQQRRASCGSVAEHFTQQGEWSYLPVPLFLTDGGWGWFQPTERADALRFGETTAIESDPAREQVWLIGAPARQLAAYIRRTGEPVLPPEWAFGVWMSANGWRCDADVDEQLQRMRANDYPASAMVLEAWSDESTFYRWSDAWPDPAATVRRVRDAGLHLILWQIPALKTDDAINDFQRADVREAVEKGYCVRNADGAPYVIPERWFAGSLLPDFSNPEARRWWFGKRQPLLDMGVEGFKTDGGEFLFGDGARLWDGTPGEAAHNAYPMRYERAYRDWMRESGVCGLTFSRAGYMGAQTAPAHWAGDQLSTWAELRGQLSAGLSAGLSGVLFWGFDIGGFAGELPTPELYLRATAMACFAPIMQWHAEPRSGQFYATHPDGFVNDRSPWNLAEKLDAPELLTVAARFARLRERLRPYLWAEARHCVAAARPMMAHLCLDFPDDARAAATDDEYMLGRRYLVAPITGEGETGREVYLPRGRWKHFFTEKEYAGGATYALDCPLDEALAFERMEAENGD